LWEGAVQCVLFATGCGRFLAGRSQGIRGEKEEDRLPEFQAAFEEKLAEVEELLGRYEGPYFLG
jgi:hypothetical protein